MSPETSIACLNLSTKPEKALKALGVTTVEEFVTVDLDKIYSISGFGVGTYRRLMSLRDGLVLEIGGDVVKPRIKMGLWKQRDRMLSVRTIHGLERLSVDSPEEFLSLNREEFCSLKSVGEKSWREVVRFKIKLCPFYDLYYIQTSNRGGSNCSDLDLEWMEISNRLSCRTKNGLRSLSVKTVDDFLAVTHDGLLKVQGIGEKSWREVKKYQHQLARYKKVSVVNGRSINDYPIFGGYRSLSEGKPKDISIDTSLSEFNFPERICSALKRLAINDFQTLLMTSPELLVKQRNFGEKSLSDLRRTILDYLDYNQNLINGELDMQDSFEAFLTYICSLSGQPENYSEIFIGRFCVSERNHNTLEYFADKFGCSRERIRQIIMKVISRLKNDYKSKPLIGKFNNIISDLLFQNRGALEFEEIAKGVSDKLGWKGPVSVLGLKEWCKSEMISSDIVVADYVIKCGHICQKCDIVSRNLIRLVDESDEVVNLRDLASSDKLCLHSDALNCPQNVQKSLSYGFLRALVNKNDLVIEDGNVYSKNQWGMQKGGLVSKVRIILDLVGGAVSKEDVYDELKKNQNSSYSLREVHRAMISCEECYIWGRNEFLHKKYIEFSKDILSTIKDILSVKLRGIPFVALHGVFKEFRETFKNAGIPNEYALSTVVDLFVDDFYVDRYRYVYNEKPDSDTSIDHHIEEWMLERGGAVRKKDLEKLIVDTIGAKKSLLGLALGRLCNVIIPERRGFLTHVDCTGLAKNNLKDFISYIDCILQDNPQVGVTNVYSKNEITCAKFGIQSPNMLYSVLRYYYSEKYDFVKYPFISELGSAKLSSRNEAISSFVMDASRIVSIEECIQHVEELGYSGNQFKAGIADIDELFEYYPGCVVHKNLIGWSVDKERELVHILATAFEKRIHAGKYVGDLEEVYELHEDELPVLSDNLGWTGNLLSSVVSMMNNIELIGNARRAYVITNHRKATTDIGQLVYMVVAKEFGGGCSRTELDDFMIELGIVKKHITPKMFDMPEGLVFKEYECYIKAEDYG